LVTPTKKFKRYVSGFIVDLTYEAKINNGILVVWVAKPWNSCTLYLEIQLENQSIFRSLEILNYYACMGFQFYHLNIAMAKKTKTTVVLKDKK